MSRLIAIKHRVKKTAEGEDRPTMVAIQEEEEVRVLKLEDDDSDLDFVYGRHPVEWRDAEPGEDLEKFLSHHIKTRKVKDNKTGKKKEMVRVPSAFEGMQKDDTVVMMLGGSGDLMLASLSRRGERIGAKVCGIHAFTFSQYRGARPKEDDHLTLLTVFAEHPDDFYEVGVRGRELIEVSEATKARMAAMKDRIACQQRLYQRARYAAFLGEVEGSIRDAHRRLKANDVIFQNLEAEEKEREGELKAKVHQLDLWKELFEPITGFGEIITARLVSTIGDIRRFRRPGEPWIKAANRLVKFCGVHVMQGGQYADVPPEKSFPRLRQGGIDFDQEARQALYLFADQMNRRKDSEWGQMFLKHKRLFREKHPERIQRPVLDKKTGKTVLKWCYTDAHIHKMAGWRALTLLVRFGLFRKWIEIEDRHYQQRREAAA